MNVSYNPNTDNYRINFTDFEGEVLADIYGNPAAITSGLSKILNEWTSDRLRHYDERRGTRLYERFKALSTDKQNEVLSILGQNESNS